jgi:hypothetical protein
MPKLVGRMISNGDEMVHGKCGISCKLPVVCCQ